MIVILKIIICVLLLILAVLLEVLIIGKAPSTFKSRQTRRIKYKKEKNKMRENLGLYKGKRKDGMGWAVGYLSLRVICTPDGAQRLGYMIQTPPDSRLYSEWHEVEPDSIGEFSGKKDKKGVMIFEGNIVKHYNDWDGSSRFDVGCVFWSENDFCFKRTSCAHGKESYFIGKDCVYEVIGNIYDNPELMDKVRDDV